MASDQQIDLLLDEIRELVRTLGSRGLSTPGTTTTDQPTKRSFSELVAAIGLLATKMEGKARTAAQETRAMEQFTKQVDAAVTREKNLAAAAAARAEADKEAAISIKERTKQEEDIHRQTMRKAAESTREQIQNLQSTRLVSRQTVEQIRASGASFGDILQNKVGDKLVKMGGSGMGAATVLESLAIAGQTLSKTFINLARSLNDGQNGAQLAAKAFSDVAEGISSLSDVVSGVLAVLGLFTKMNPWLRVLSIAGSAAAWGLGKFVKGVDEVNKMASKNLDALQESFVTISKFGAAGMRGFADIREGLQLGFMSIGANLKEYTQFLSKNASELRVFGSSIHQVGRAAIEVAGTLDKQMGPSLNAMGIFNEDLREAALTNISLLGRAGKLQLDNSLLMQKQTYKLAMEMDQLSMLTGKQKDEVAKSLRDATLNDRFAAALASARRRAAEGDPEAEARLRELTGIQRLAALAKNLGLPEKGILEFGAGGPVGGEAAAAMQQFNLTNFMRMARERGGELKPGELMEFLSESIRSAPDLLGVEAVRGPLEKMTVGPIGAREDIPLQTEKLLKLAGEKGFFGPGALDKLLEAIQKGRITDLTPEQKAMIDAMRNFRQAAIVQDQGLSEFKFASYVLEKSSETFQKAVEKFGEYVGLKPIAGGLPGTSTTGGSVTSRPPTLSEQAQAAVTQARENTKKIAAETGIGSDETKQARRAEQEARRRAERAFLEEQGASRMRGRGIQPSTPATASSATTTAPPEENLNDLFVFTTGGGTLEAFNQLQPEFRKKVIEAAKEYKQFTGGKLQINSARRTPEQQQKAYEEYIGGISPIIAAAPNSPNGSLHIQGLAVDIQQGLNRDTNAIRALNRNGLRQSLGERDLVHFTMANGGILNATPGGVPVLAAEAGKNEAFVPLPDGKRIPVSFNTKSFVDAMKLKDVDLATETKETLTKTLNNYLGDFKSYGGALDSIRTLADGFNNLNDGIRQVIDILDTSKNIQNNLLQASYT